MMSATTSARRHWLLQLARRKPHRVESNPLASSSNAPRFRRRDDRSLRTLLSQPSAKNRAAPSPRSFEPLPTRLFSTASSAASTEDLEDDDGYDDGDDRVFVGVGSDRRNMVVDAFLNDSDDLFASEASERLSADIADRADLVLPAVLEARRLLHCHAELMYQEEETAAAVRRFLDQRDIAYSAGWAINTRRDRIPGNGGHGVVCDLGTGRPPCVLLRADMDALPIREDEGEEEDAVSDSSDSVSQRCPNGRMHACGHDGHMAMLLGAASILKDMEDSLPGTVRIVFQPAEEGGAGAKRMVEEGLLKTEPTPSAAFAMHVWPSLPSGVIACRPGPQMAACERFEVKISGVGGHAAMPHLTVDPIVTAAAVILNVQAVVSRTVDPLESAVVSITTVNAGTGANGAGTGGAFNVIPESVVVRGTIRALSTETLLALRDRVQNVIDSTCSVHGCEAATQYSTDYYPPTINDPELVESFSKRVGNLVANAAGGRFSGTESPSMGAEDFSFIAQNVPSTFFFLGQGDGDRRPRTDYGLHHPRFHLNEDILATGVQLHVNLAVRALRHLANNL